MKRKYCMNYYSKLLGSLLLMSFAVPVFAQDMIEVSSANRVAIGVKTERLKSASTVELVRATGLVIAPINQKQSISSPFEGVLIKPLIVAGMEVKKGQNLALLYSADYAATKVERQQADLMAEHNAGLAKRAAELGEIGLRSVEEVDEAEHEAQSSLISLVAMDKRLSRVRSAGGSGQFYVMADHAGTVTHVHAEAGASLANSQPFATIFSGDTFWANVPVPEANIDLISIGTDVSLLNSDMIGTVIAIDPEVDGLSRTVNVTLKLPDEHRWRLGSLVTAKFLTPRPPNSVAVPTRAIVRMSGQTYIFQEVDGGFETVPVSILSQSDQTSFVTGRISEGNQVAVSGLAALKNVVEGG